MNRALLILLCISGCRGQRSYVEVPPSELEPYDSLFATHETLDPAGGVVGDARTAARIAEAVLEAAYGQESIRLQRPLRVGVRDSVWIVRGTLPDDYLGGVAHIEILRMDGRIIRVSHGH